jgi:hypothetical protein
MPERRSPLILLLAAALTLAFVSAAHAQAPSWPWLADGQPRETLEARFAPPEGFARVPLEPGSFGAFLRRLPLLPEGASVRAFDGRTLGTPHVAVVELDVGDRDLQQCADSALRLRAEFLWSKGAQERVAFHTTSGDLVPFARYAHGEALAVRGNKVGWHQGSDAGGLKDRAAFHRFLDDVFLYAGSLSIARDTEAAAGNVRPGDLFVVGGSPGHVLVVLDVAARGAERRLLIGEGYMPAQNFHVVPSVDGGAWITPGPDGAVRVPTWSAPFPRAALRRFPERAP